MKKIIKSWGGSLGILLDSEDVKIFNLKVGDIVDLEFRKQDFNWEEMHKRVEEQDTKELSNGKER